uniref:Heterochromatin protein 1-like n=1 Tax=Nicotiana tabacum TaxID=4097 RepID=A0A1S3ZT52_TOBAC|nr:PREDICTED: heterochromatin protein 1-like [Nicotiana tabacum]
MEDPSLSQLTIPSIRGPNSTGKRRVEDILDDRVICASRKDHQEFLVKWQGCDAEENTWERGTNLKAYTSLIKDYLASKAPRTSPTQRHGRPRGLAVPSDKRAYAYVTLPIALASAQPQTDANSVAHADSDAKDKVAANGSAAAL